ncbi:glycosyltransferase family A protein [Flavobacterium sp. SUN052]|uniref:glycosyltransferase family A protein n=1 Tax=Flavobacterium sp. SUN052 TaxID=3002441 RepID=UPI00237DE4D7|nr:glycosyltransferase family A protein [Flavobacterium sp. SUN052]MEC4004453.1 glycosyltransferase family A protein [Flavobacterium sp. SUN052]
MRIGMNPQKSEKKIELKSNHRVVIVAFIPKLEGYYESVFEVLKLNLQSIIATKNEFCEITVVNNGCCEIVVNYLNSLFTNKEIDCIIHHNQNIGKIDALIGAARTARESLITMTDLDILFVKGWQESIEEIFQTFNDVGSVSPISTYNAKSYGAISTLSKIILKRVNFNYEPIKENFDSQNKFFESFGWNKLERDDILWPVLEKNGVKAILGSHHQVITIRRDVLFSFVPFKPSFTLVGNNSEYEYVDLPNDLSGKMRLSTYRNYAFHMGNKIEDWMIEIQNNNLNSTNVSSVKTIKFKTNDIQNNKLNLFIYKVKKKFVKKIFKMFYDK